MPIAISDIEDSAKEALTFNLDNPGNDVFPNPGRIATIATTALPITISMQCWKPGFVFRAIITQASVSAQGGFQFMHTLSDYIYLYIFNERIGEMTISGLTFMGGCDTGAPTAGIEAVLAYYYTMRATRRYSPIQVSIGRLAFNAFLMGVKTDITDADTGLGHFTFSLYYPPINTDVLGIINDPCLLVNLPTSGSVSVPPVSSSGSNFGFGSGGSFANVPTSSGSFGSGGNLDLFPGLVAAP